jgi:hypothetical protein
MLHIYFQAGLKPRNLILGLDCIYLFIFGINYFMQVFLSFWVKKIKHCNPKSKGKLVGYINQIKNIRKNITN